MLFIVDFFGMTQTIVANVHSDTLSRSISLSRNKLEKT